MSDPGVFAAGVAAFITGVSEDVQRDWRRRGFLPSSEGRHTRYTVRDLCRLRLMRAVLDAGFPVGIAVAQISDDFLDSLQAEVIAIVQPEFSGGNLAFIAGNSDNYYRAVVSTYHDLSNIVKDPAYTFDSFHVVQLAKIAEDMVSKGILDHPGLKDR